MQGQLWKACPLYQHSPLKSVYWKWMKNWKRRQRGKEEPTVLWGSYGAQEGAGSPGRAPGGKWGPAKAGGMRLQEQGSVWRWLQQQLHAVQGSSTLSSPCPCTATLLPSPHIQARPGGPVLPRRAQADKTHPASPARQYYGGLFNATAHVNKILLLWILIKGMIVSGHHLKGKCFNWFWCLFLQKLSLQKPSIPGRLLSLAATACPVRVQGGRWERSRLQGPSSEMHTWVKEQEPFKIPKCH